MSLYDDASLIMFPSGYKEDKIYSLKPTDGSGDLTFTRASTATRVNSDGLIETASVLGSELVVNGDFASDTSWTKATGWTISGGVGSCNITNDSYGGITQNILSVGKIYIINYSIVSYTSGSIKLGVGGGLGVLRNSVGNYTETLTSTTHSTFGIYSWGNFTGTIDNVSVKEVITLDVPRIDYTGGGCGKLLLESQRTNLLTYSEQFDNAVYTKRNSTISSNVTTSPDGTSNADKIQEDTSNDRHDIYTGFTCTNGVTYTQTIFAKQGERRYCFMSFGTAILNASDSFFDLQDGVVASSPSGVTSSIENMGNGWYRCRITTTCSGDGTGYFVNGPANTSSNYIYQGVSGYGIYIYGVQLEASSYATSYIPTLASSVTRLADSASKTGISSLIGQTEGTMFVEFFYNEQNTIPSGSDKSVCRIKTGGGYADEIAIVYYGDEGGSYGKTIQAFITNGGVPQAILKTPQTMVSGYYKVAVAYKANDFAMAVNGVIVATENSGSVPTCADFLLNESTRIQSDINPKQALLFPTRLTNTQLATLTTL